MVLGVFWIFYKTIKICTKVDVSLTLLCIIFWEKLLLSNQCFTGTDIVHIEWIFLLFYEEMEVICNVLEMFLSCSSFQEHSFLAVEIYWLQWKSIVTQFVLWCYFLKSRMDSNIHLTSLDCSRLDFWRSLIRLSELLLSSFHPDIFVCQLFGADNLSKAALAIQNTFCLFASSVLQWPSCACPWSVDMGWNVCLSLGTAYFWTVLSNAFF